jgi:hypothetical protein
MSCHVMSCHVMINRRLLIEFDEATDCTGIGHFIAYVRHVEDTTINEHMLSGNL